MKKFLLVALLALASMATADEYRSECCAQDQCNKFDEKITALLKEGWQLYGSPSASMSVNDFVFCQALIKKNNPKPKPKMIKTYALQCWEPGDGRVSDGIMEYVCNGWQVYGNPFVDPHSKEVCQMFVREVLEKDLKCPQEVK